MNSNILILGASGQLARHLKLQMPTATAWGRNELDLTNVTLLRKKICEFQPSCIVNAAAYTAVDKAEEEVHRAYLINAGAIAEIGRVAVELDIPVVHFSTDYVFDGSKVGGYLEGDSVNPINAYGRTKLAGELALECSGAKYWTFRTSWVFSEYAGNFLTTMLRLGREHSVLRVVNDQFGRPTFAGELARVTQRLLNDQLTLDVGLHHLGCPDSTTWFEFATEIFACVQQLDPGYKIPVLEPVSTEEYPTAARRPMNSCLETSPTLGVRRWKDCLGHCVQTALANVVVR